MLAVAKIIACSLTIGIGGSGGVFAPSLFVGVTSGIAFGDVVRHRHVFARTATRAIAAIGTLLHSARQPVLRS